MSPDKLLPAARSAEARVLVADADLAVRSLLVDVLELEGLCATTAASGDEVLEVLRRDSPRLVLLDPSLNGFKPARFVNACRATRRREAVPVVVLSALPRAPDALCRLATVAFMRKPFDIDELLEVVCRYYNATPRQLEPPP
jgi:DNA-binding response OmpR family regulator